MMLCWIDSDGVSNHDVVELADLRKRTDGFLWLDIAEWSEEAEATLTNEFQFHPLAIAESKTRSHVPRVHVYPDHVFIVVHAPEIGAAGHVHYLELDQFIGNDFLVTVHGPISPKVSLEAALRETEAVAARMQSGRLLPILTVRPQLRDCLLDRATRIAHGRRDCPRGRPDGAAGHG
jgi:magnesium transporter